MYTIHEKFYAFRIGWLDAYPAEAPAVFRPVYTAWYVRYYYTGAVSPSEDLFKLFNNDNSRDGRAGVLKTPGPAEFVILFSLVTRGLARKINNNTIFIPKDRSRTYIW